MFVLGGVNVRIGVRTWIGDFRWALKHEHWHHLRWPVGYDMDLMMGTLAIQQKNGWPFWRWYSENVKTVTRNWKVGWLVGRKNFTGTTIWGHSFVGSRVTGEVPGCLVTLAACPGRLPGYNTLRGCMKFETGQNNNCLREPQHTPVSHTPGFPKPQMKGIPS